MKMSVHLNFSGNCRDAFAFYQKVFKAETPFSMTYGQAPEGALVPAGWNDKVMHTAIPLGSGALMGCDAPPDRTKPIGGFQVCLEDKDQAEVERMFEALSEGGSATMPLQKTFWSPMFGMLTDKFGVNWMLSVPGEQPTA